MGATCQSGRRGQGGEPNKWKKGNFFGEMGLVVGDLKLAGAEQSGEFVQAAFFVQDLDMISEDVAPLALDILHQVFVKLLGEGRFVLGGRHGISKGKLAPNVTYTPSFFQFFCEPGLWGIASRAGFI